MAATNSPGGPLRGGTIYSMTVPYIIWESLYSPMLKYGSYRSHDLKLRHRKRCVRERPRARERLSSPRSCCVTSSYYNGRLPCVLLYFDLDC